MSGDKVTGREFDTGVWEAQERDGAIVLSITDDQDDDEQRAPLAVVMLTREDVLNMLVALELAEQKREASPTT